MVSTSSRRHCKICRNVNAVPCTISFKVITREPSNISFDINYRQKLWTTQDAARVLEPLIQNVTLLFCSRTDAQRVFGLNGTPEELAQQLHALSRAQNVVLTLQAEGVLAFDGENFLRAPALPVHIIDRLGAGDALAAGVLHGWLDKNLAQGLRYGTTLAALALSQHGDMVITHPAEVEQLLQNQNALVR